MPKVTEIFERVPRFTYLEEAIETSAPEFEKVVCSRRSTRVYTDAPIAEDVMRRCLELALLAPNSSNLQPFEFYWVRDESKKRRLAELCLGQPAATTARELVVCVARLDTWRRNRRLMLDTFDQSEKSVPKSAAWRRMPRMTRGSMSTNSTTRWAFRLPPRMRSRRFPPGK